MNCGNRNGRNCMLPVYMNSAVAGHRLLHCRGVLCLRKFIQVAVTASGCQPYVLSGHSLTVDTGDVDMTALNHPQQTLVG